MTTRLYPFQTEIQQRVAKKFREGKRAVMMQAPTGAGKTVIMADLARKISKSGRRIVIGVHRQEILLQTSLALVNAGITHDAIASDPVKRLMAMQSVRNGHAFHCLLAGAPVMLASLPLMMRRRARQGLPQASYFFFDEAHHCAAKSWQETFRHYWEEGQCRILGATATPERLDGLPLGGPHGMFEVLVQGPTLEELVNGGFLARPDVFSPPESVDTTGVHISGGDWDRRELGDNAIKITGHVIGHYKQYFNGRTALVFCVNVKHSQQIAAEFNAAGILAESIDGDMAPATRANKLARLAAGELTILTSCDLIGEGLDIPSVGGAIFLRPTKSRALYMQQVGRALRISAGKDRAIILDHANNTMTHGHPLDVHEYDFLGTPKSKSEGGGGGMKLTICSACRAAVRAGPPVCPSCGAPLIRLGMNKEIKVVEGDLALNDRDLPPESKAWSAVWGLGDGVTEGSIEEIAEAHGLTPEWVAEARRRLENILKLPLFSHKPRGKKNNGQGGGHPGIDSRPLTKGDHDVRDRTRRPSCDTYPGHSGRDLPPRRRNAGRTTARTFSEPH